MTKRKRLLTTLTVITLVIGGFMLSRTFSLNYPNDPDKGRPLREQEQLAYLKEHEEEIMDFVKAQSPTIESVQIDWESFDLGPIGNGLPQGGGWNLSLSGTFNHQDNTSFSVDFYLDRREDLPDINKIGMLNSLYIERNGGWDIYER